MKHYITFEIGYTTYEQADEIINHMNARFPYGPGAPVDGPKQTAVRYGPIDYLEDETVS